MSYCKQLGKDRIIFATKEDHSKPSTVELSEESGEEVRGLIQANGDINWNCPCLGGMASGPCGYQFRQAFACFHYSTQESKGSDCIEKFTQMHECMKEFPNLYPNNTNDDEDLEALKDNHKDMDSLGPQVSDKSTNEQKIVENHSNPVSNQRKT